MRGGKNRLDTKIQCQLTFLALLLLVDATADNQLNQSYKLRLVPHLMANFGIHVKTHDSIHEMTRDRLAMIARVSDFLYAIAYREMVRGLSDTGVLFQEDRRDAGKEAS